MAPSGSSERRASDNPLVEAYFERREALVLFLAARTRCMATAEDLAQDLFVRLSALDPAEVKAPAAMLYRMATNLMIDHVRSAQRASRRDADWRRDTHAQLGGEDVVGETPADEAIISRERVRLLADAVNGLPPQMGRAFRLHKLDGLSQAQTAQAMGVSVKMVEQHVAAAIRRLTERLRS